MKGTFTAWRDEAHPGWLCYVLKVGNESRRLRTRESSKLGQWLLTHL